MIKASKRSISSKLLTASILAAPLLLISPLSIAIAAPQPSGFVQLADGEVPVNDRLSYMHQTQVKMQEWKHKLRDLSEKAKASGQSAEASTDKDLQKLWEKTKAASRKLQAASADDWEAARASYETESHNLDEAWKKRFPDSQ